MPKEYELWNKGDVTGKKLTLELLIKIISLSKAEIPDANHNRVSESLTAHQHKKGHVVPKRYELWSKGDVTGKNQSIESRYS